MEYKHLGRMGLLVSRFCLGTMNFITHTTEADGFTSSLPDTFQGVTWIGKQKATGIGKPSFRKWSSKASPRRNKLRSQR